MSENCCWINHTVENDREREIAGSGGKRMDTFIDKIAQRRNAQEMILANMTAEAAKMEQMQNQMKAYDELMQEIRRVNLKTAENLANVQGTLKEYMEKLEAIQADNSESEENREALAQLRENLDEKFRQSDDLLHKENVKVYRNVQAAVTEELNKQTEELKKSQRENRGSRALLPISIVILLAVLADIAVQLFGITIVF